MRRRYMRTAEDALPESWGNKNSFGMFAAPAFIRYEKCNKRDISSFILFLC